MDEQLKKALDLVGEIPAIPQVANRVMTAVGDAGTSADDLREIIEIDPSLAARILRVANSSLYGFRREVETLRHAITLLGFRSVESIVMAASLRDVFRNFGLSEKLLWEHSTLTGVVAGRLAQYGAIDVEREPAFTAGLLHDIGKVALANTYRKEYALVMARTYNEGVSFVEAERHQFGFDHALLGAHIAETWDLPDALIAAIRHHHDEPAAIAERPAEQARLVALTSVATRVCTRLGLGRRGPIEAIDITHASGWGVLGLGEDDVEPVIELATNEAKEAEGLFG